MTDNGDRRARPLTREQALQQLASVPLGRAVFTYRRRPAIQPAYHIVEGGQVIIRGEGAAVKALAGGDVTRVVTYQADQVIPAIGAGWSVTITGPASLVTDPHQAARYCRAVPAWGTGPMNQVIRIEAQLVTGYQMTAHRPSAAA